MLTAEDISNVEFTKTLGGYKTVEVDDFLDECADTVAALNNEKAALNKKLEVLADKVVEYRDKLEEYQKEEDSIKTALVTAQRMGDSVLREANQKAELILQDAEIKAQNIQQLAEQKIVKETEELNRLRQAVSDFKDQLYKQYKTHLELIGLLPQVDTAPASEPVTKESEQVAEETHPEENAGVCVESAQVEEEQSPVQQVVVSVPSDEEAETVKIFASESEEAEAEQIVPPIDDNDATLPFFPAAEETEENTESAFAQNNSRFSDIRFGEEYDMKEEPEEERRGFFKRKKS